MNLDQLNKLVIEKLEPIKRIHPYFTYDITRNILKENLGLHISCRVPIFRITGTEYKKFGSDIIINSDQINMFDDKVVEVLFIDNMLEKLQNVIGDVYVNQNYDKYEKEVTEKR